MNIAIIGTGNIGSGLARTFAKTRHGVVVADRKGGQALADTLKGEGLTVQAASIAEAVAQADAIIFAVPYGAVAAIAAEADFEGKIVIDVTNPITEDFSALSVSGESSAAEEIAKLLPAARVVKAFNTVFAGLYGGSFTFGGHTLQTFVASDDEAARDAVISLAKDAGFDARNAGGLKNARYLEPLGFMNIQFGYMLGQGTEIAPLWLAR
ncbi:NADPH-dependent F420 reductase [Martelella alba]|uniref:NADPH-dependent F420 reductase n=1 Tax=Martelella alba TaxID=2590451 RepID=A0A506U4B3_9HYPH|nr:NADPH-dependent F420 reductase [Martelella alba]TPW29192.1 NADPH-dependent F420 reductase [Martelella alba]